MIDTSFVSIVFLVISTFKNPGEVQRIPVAYIIQIHKSSKADTNSNQYMKQQSTVTQEGTKFSKELIKTDFPYQKEHLCRLLNDNGTIIIRQRLEDMLFPMGAKILGFPEALNKSPSRRLISAMLPCHKQSNHVQGPKDTTPPWTIHGHSSSSTKIACSRVRAVAVIANLQVSSLFQEDFLVILLISCNIPFL